MEEDKEDEEETENEMVEMKDINRTLFHIEEMISAIPITEKNELQSEDELKKLLEWVLRHLSKMTNEGLHINIFLYLCTKLNLVDSCRDYLNSSNFNITFHGVYNFLCISNTVDKELVQTLFDRFNLDTNDDIIFVSQLPTDLFQLSPYDLIDLKLLVEVAIETIIRLMNLPLIPRVVEFGKINFGIVNSTEEENWSSPMDIMIFFICRGMNYIQNDAQYAFIVNKLLAAVSLTELEPDVRGLFYPSDRLIKAPVQQPWFSQKTIDLSGRMENTFSFFKAMHYRTTYKILHIMAMTYLGLDSFNVHKEVNYIIQNMLLDEYKTFMQMYLILFVEPMPAIREKYKQLHWQFI